MSHPDQIDIRQVKDGWTLEFPFNEEFIEYLKRRVPYRDRAYDEDSRIWTIKKDEYMPAIEGVAVQRFRHAVRIYRNAEGKLCTRNLKTGAESIQEELFS